MIAPTKSLRETASSSGRPERVQVAERAHHLDRLRRRLAEVGPGIERSAARTPRRARGASEIRSARNVRTSSTTPPVEARVEQLLLGRRARVHQHQAGAGLSAHVGQLGVAQAADVVDDRRAGRDRRPRHRPACRCRPTPARRAHRRPARSAAPRARSPPRASTAGRLVTPDSPPMSITSAPLEISDSASATRASSVRGRPAVGERVRRGVDDPHQPRPAAELDVAARAAKRPPRRDHLTTPAPGTRLAPPRRSRSTSSAIRASSQPSSAPIARATRDGPSAPGASSERAGQQAQPGAPQQHVADGAGLFVARPRRSLGEQVGMAGHDRLRQRRRARAASAQQLAGRRGRSEPASAA